MCSFFMAYVGKEGLEGLSEERNEWGGLRGERKEGRREIVE